MTSTENEQRALRLLEQLRDTAWRLRRFDRELPDEVVRHLEDESMKLEDYVEMMQEEMRDGDE